SGDAFFCHRQRAPGLESAGPANCPRLCGCCGGRPNASRHRRVAQPLRASPDRTDLCPSQGMASSIMCVHQNVNTPNVNTFKLCIVRVWADSDEPCLRLAGRKGLELTQCRDRIDCVQQEGGGTQEELVANKVVYCSLPWTAPTA